MSLLIDMGHNRKAFYCPGCKTHHIVDDKWTFSGTPEAPTIRASVLTRWTEHITDEEADRIMAGEVIKKRDIVCHSYVTDGKIEYLSDCTHELAGKTVPMEDLGL